MESFKTVLNEWMEIRKNNFNWKEWNQQRNKNMKNKGKNSQIFWRRKKKYSDMTEMWA